MIIEITAGELAGYLKKLSLCCKSSSFSITKCVLLSAKDGQLTAYATNVGDLTMRLAIACNVKEDGDALVDADLLLNAAARLKKDDSMTLRKDVNTLQVSCVRFKANLPLADLYEFPDVRGAFDKVSWSVKVDAASELKAAVARVSQSISTDMTRNEFTGVFFKLSSSRTLTLVSTDGHRLTVSTACVDAKSDGLLEEGIIVSGSKLAAIVNWFGESMKIATNGNKTFFSDSSCAVSVSNIAGTFPDFTKVIPNESTLPCVFEVSRNELASMIKRISSFSNKSGTIRLSFDKKDIHAVTHNDSGADSSDAIALNSMVCKQDVVIGINGSYLLSAFAVMTCDNVKVGVESMDSPLVIKDPTRNDQTFIIMPMQI